MISFLKRRWSGWRAWPGRYEELEASTLLMTTMRCGVVSGGGSTTRRGRRRWGWARPPSLDVTGGNYLGVSIEIWLRPNSASGLWTGTPLVCSSRLVSNRSKYIGSGRSWVHTTDRSVLTTRGQKSPLRVISSPACAYHGCAASRDIHVHSFSMLQIWWDS
jgi:hypothetical protein